MMKFTHIYYFDFLVTTTNLWACMFLWKIYFEGSKHLKKIEKTTSHGYLRRTSWHANDLIWIGNHEGFPDFFAYYRFRSRLIQKIWKIHLSSNNLSLAVRNYHLYSLLVDNLLFLRNKFVSHVDSRWVSKTFLRIFNNCFFECLANKFQKYR